MEFKIRDDFELRSYSTVGKKFKEFTPQEISNAVAYFTDKINKVPSEEGKTLGLALGYLGALQLFFMLALIRSGRSYSILYCDNAFLDQTIAEEKCNHIFLVGPWSGIDYDYLLPEYASFIENLRYPECYTEIFNPQIEKEALEFNSPYDLTFRFDPKQKIYISFQPGVAPKLAYNTGKIEESCVEAAMRVYYLKEDIVGLVRPFRHIGVATLAIYPAVFKAKKVILCSWLSEWEKEYHSATHVHAPYEMIRDQWPLPKKLRMLTSGGYPFNSECIKYVTDISDIDNIVDCFGTSYCPPPLAIRRLSKNDTEVVPFKWVNEYIKPLNMMFFTSDDPNAFSTDVDQLTPVENGLVKTSDLVINPGPGLFQFLGSHFNYVRANQARMTEKDFVKFVEENVELGKFVLKFVYIDKVKEPIIEVQNRYKDQWEQFVKNNSVEINTRYVNDR
jgi:hypothetical protein